MAFNVHASIIVTNTYASGLRSSLRVTGKFRTQGLPIVIRIKNDKTHLKNTKCKPPGYGIEVSSLRLELWQSKKKNTCTKTREVILVTQEISLLKAKFAIPVLINTSTD